MSENRLISALDKSIASVRELLVALEDCRKIANGEQTEGQHIAAVFDAYGKAWQRRYRTTYTFTRARDGANIKRLVRELGLEELLKRIVRYFADLDAYVSGQRHPFGLFVSRINTYARADPSLLDDQADDDDDPAPADCRHTPRCQTDVEHTRRRAADMKGRRS